MKNLILFAVLSLFAATTFNARAEFIFHPDGTTTIIDGGFIFHPDGTTSIIMAR